jgi:hypothetical protein
MTTNLERAREWRATHGKDPHRVCSQCGDEHALTDLVKLLDEAEACGAAKNLEECVRRLEVMHRECRSEFGKEILWSAIVVIRARGKKEGT